MPERTYTPILIAAFSNDGLIHMTNTIDSLVMTELARLYVDMAFFGSAAKFIDEERWLQNRNLRAEVPIEHFFQELFKAELMPLLFLKDFFKSTKIEKIVSAGKLATEIENAVVQTAKSKKNAQQKIFATTALSLMSDLFEFENQLMLSKQRYGQHLGLSLYRTFDQLDAIFNLSYSADAGMPSLPTTTERLYEGAGVGVQSGYSSALMALRHLNPPQGSRFIDLGAGYGRIGLIVGLLRPDIVFQGYEYVPHRVNIAAATSEKLGLSQHVQFKTQDLSLKDFTIPVADTYYIYDSFTESTYQHVLSQLQTISQKQKITIVTKGNARNWMESSLQNGHWKISQQFDNGNLCFYQTG